MIPSTKPNAFPPDDRRNSAHTDESVEYADLSSLFFAGARFVQEAGVYKLYVPPGKAREIYEKLLADRVGSVVLNVLRERVKAGKIGIDKNGKPQYN